MRNSSVLRESLRGDDIWMLKHLMPSESRECCTLLPTDIADYSVIVTVFHSVI